MTDPAHETDPRDDYHCGRYEPSRNRREEVTVYEPGAPKQWWVPAQRDASPSTIPETLPPPFLAARDGHHDWGAVVAVLAALLALATLLGPGTSVADADSTTSSSAS